MSRVDCGAGAPDVPEVPYWWRKVRIGAQGTDGFAEVHARSVGRWRDELTAEQVADVEREAGALLRELGYSES